VSTTSVVIEIVTQENSMTPQDAHNQIMTLIQGNRTSHNLRVQALAEMALGNKTLVSKAQDYDYFENKRMVTLDEAVGIREVAAKTSPGGPSPA
jgi:hypothetical protein